MGVLNDLLPFGEETWLDWKREFPPVFGRMNRKEAQQHGKEATWDESKSKLLKDLVSLANGDDDFSQTAGCLMGRAFLVYGVKDLGHRRQVFGIEKHWDDAVFQQWNADFFDPPLDLSYREEMVPEGHVGVFEIRRSPKYPHVAKRTLGKLYKGQVWFRRGTSNSEAMNADLRRMVLGHQPVKVEGLDSPLLSRTKSFYAETGRQVVFELFMKKDERLYQGYEIAYFPNTRREIWIGSYGGSWDHIAMLKPPIP